MLGSITGLLKKFLGNKSDKDIKEIQPLLDKALAFENQLSALSHNDLRAKTIEFKAKINAAIESDQNQINELQGNVDANYNLPVEEKEKIYEQIDAIEKTITTKIEEVLAEILPEAFAVIKETAKRFSNNPTIEVTATPMDEQIAQMGNYVEIQGDKAIWHNEWDAAGATIKWDMVHYNVQLIGGTVLHQGKIAEMATGEGKTLVATLPVYLNALPGRGVHVVTVNDYLAKRDSEWMAPIFQFHGLTVDCIDKHQPNSEARRKAYRADITYGTNNEFGFDYLRDNMANSPEELVQRKHNYAIVDEVDSVLIDDARTPLIISGPTPKGDQQEFNALKPKVERLVNAQRQLINNLLTEAKKKLAATSEVISDKKELNKTLEEGGLALFRAYRGLPKNKALIKFLSEEGVKTALLKTEAVYLQDNAREMPKADEELYFTIDEKNNTIELTDKGIDLITDSANDPNFYVMPDIASELAELEKKVASKEELAQQKEALISDYSVKSDRIHTINQLLKAYTLFENDVEYVVMDNKVKIVDEQTGRIMEGRRYSDGLHQAIEAKENVKIEAATQTYATVTLQNYFRMYNKLSGMTGTAETESAEFWEIYELDVVVIPTNRPIARNDREDLVYKTKREKYNAVIDEIVRLKELGRPVLVGTTSVEVSELLSRMLKLRKVTHNVLNAKQHQREAEIVAEAGKIGAVTIATNMAGRGTDIKLSKEVKDLGGLAIIGTERHESRRVDRQLRGRAGRQGDPGSSQFYVSLEDDLMRLFSSDRVSKLMDRMGFEEGEVIQHSMITKSIERAQRKVEENNFGIRKRLLEYDDVMNAQREVIYKKRKHALFGERMGVEIANAIYDTCESIVAEFHGQRDFGGFDIECIRLLNMQSPISEDEFLSTGEATVLDKLYETALSNYNHKSEQVAKMAFPVIQNVFENPENNFQSIRVPLTDGRRFVELATNLEKAYNTKGLEIVRTLEKAITLMNIDQHWKEHLREMDDLRQSVQGAVYEQKDPLLVYKFESFELFKQMLAEISKEIVPFIIRASIPVQNPNQVQEAKPVAPAPQQNLTASKAEVSRVSPEGTPQAHDPSEKPKQAPVVVDKKIGRNDRVEVLNPKTGETKEMKFKQAEPLVAQGWQILNK